MDGGVSQGKDAAYPTGVTTKANHSRQTPHPRREPINFIFAGFLTSEPKEERLIDFKL